MEQLVARRAHNPEAAGSNPVPATKKSDRPKRDGFFYYGAYKPRRSLMIEERSDSQENATAKGAEKNEATGGAAQSGALSPQPAIKIVQ